MNVNFHKRQLTRRIQAVLPIGRNTCVESILAIMDGLCPTCTQNKYFNPACDKDCTKRAGHVSASQVYDGECDEDTLEHWLGALEDYLGALFVLGEHLDEHPLARGTHAAYVDGCVRAQRIKMEHINDAHFFVWKFVEEKFPDDFILRVGAAYKDADPEDPIFSDYQRRGQEDAAKRYPA